MIDAIWVAAADVILPSPHVAAADWIPNEIIIPSDTETPGPFDTDLLPHVPDVLKEIDNPDTRRIFLCWAARNGKTTTALAALICLCTTAPRPALFASANEERTDDTIDTQLYPLAESCEATASKLPDRRPARKRGIQIGPCRIRRAFSGSPSTLAGFPSAYSVASELSKWSTRASTEADPLFLFGQRSKLFPFDSKLIYESTPGLVGECQITKLMESPTTDRRRRWAKCPHCGVYQLLEFGNKVRDTPGIKWQKDRLGRSDPIRAADTAYYRCVNACKITNADRPELLRNAVWLSEGRRISKSGRVTGRATVRSADVGFGPLASWYSLVISGWGQIVSEFLTARGDRDALRDFTNSTVCQVWDPAPKPPEHSTLAERLRGPVDRGVCPDWTKFSTFAADVGKSGDVLIFFWQVCAWGLDRVGHMIDWGIAFGEDELNDTINDANHPIDGRDDFLRPCRIGLDSGGGRFDQTTVTKTVLDICKRLGRYAYPLKGSSGDYGPDLYRWIWSRADVSKHAARELRRKKKTGTGDLMEINTHLTQSYRMAIVDGTVSAGQSESMTLPADVCDDLGGHADLFDELTSDYLIEGRWKKRGPNEYGDTLRYNRALAAHRTKADSRWCKLTAERQVGRSAGSGSAVPSNRLQLLGPGKRPRLKPGD